MEIRKSFEKIILISISIYIPLFSICFLVFLINNKTNLKIRENTTLNIINDKKKKISAVKEGFMPLYFPNKLLSNNKDISVLKLCVLT